MVSGGSELIYPIAKWPRRTALCSSLAMGEVCWMSGTARSKKISGAYCIGKWLLGSKKAACIIDGRALSPCRLTLRPPAFHLSSLLSAIDLHARVFARPHEETQSPCRGRWVVSHSHTAAVGWGTQGRSAANRLGAESGTDLISNPRSPLPSRSSSSSATAADPGTSAHPSCLSAAAILATIARPGIHIHDLDLTLSTTSSAKHIHLLTAVRP